MSEDQKVSYNPIYGRFLIVMGILFTIIFILGFVVADMASALSYCLLSAFMIIAGYGMTTGPYAIYDDHQITTFTFGLRERKTYSFKSKGQIVVKGKLLYLDGKKLQMNAWFIRQHEWKRMLDFYSSSDESLLTELKDSSSL